MKQLNKWHRIGSSNYYYPFRETPKRVVGLFISVPEKGEGQVRIISDMMYNKNDLDIVLDDVKQIATNRALIDTIFTRALSFKL